MMLVIGSIFVLVTDKIFCHDKISISALTFPSDIAFGTALILWEITLGGVVGLVC